MEKWDSVIIPLTPSYRDLSKSELLKLLRTELHLRTGKGIGGDLNEVGAACFAQLLLYPLSI